MKKWRELTFIMVLQEMIFLSYQSEFRRNYDAFTEELLLPVDPEKNTIISLEEGSGDFPYKNFYITHPPKTTGVKMHNKTKFEKTDHPENSNRGYAGISAENQKVVLAERTPIPVVVVLIFLTVMLLCSGITIAVLCRKLRSMRKWRYERTPVKIVQKLEDSDEYSVMMDWT